MAQINETSLAAYLEAALPGFRGPLRLTPLVGGQSNPTFLVATKGGSYVLRKKPDGAVLASAHAIDREYRVLSALSGAGFRAPHVYHYCERVDVIGTPFYIMEYVAGRIVADPALPGLSPPERAALYGSMNETLARLHTIDWREIGLGDLGRPDRYAARQIERWRRQSDNASVAPLPQMERLHDWLAESVPDNEMATLTHGDYRIGNLMIDASTPCVAAVLDWELATIGHPWADLAFNCMAYYFPPGAGPASGIAGLDLDSLGIPNEQRYLEDYAHRTGSDPRPHWRFFMTLSLYRTAAIQQGVYARALAGQAQGPQARMFAQLCQTTAAIACDVAFGRRALH